MLDKGRMLVKMSCCASRTWSIAQRATHQDSRSSAQNVVEKVVQAFAETSAHGGTHTLHAGDLVYVRPWRVMTHDNTAPVIAKFASVYGFPRGTNVSELPRVADPKQLVFTLDHDVQNTLPTNLQKYATIKLFAQHQGVSFHNAGRGIGHQIMIEEGFAFPQTLTVASDSHSNMYGGVGCLGTPIVRTDACAVWATGRTWFEVPNVVRVNLLGRLRPGVTGKDVIVTLCTLFNRDEVLNSAVEFHLEHPQSMPIDFRLTIANMTTEWGSLAGLFPVDEVTLDYYYKLARRLEATASIKAPNVTVERVDTLARNILVADPNCRYIKNIDLDLSTVSQYVSGPNAVKVAKPAAKLTDKKINKAYLVSCTNSRLSDIEAAANVIRDFAKMKNLPLADVKFNKSVKLYLSAASSVVQRDAEESGSWKILIDAGAVPLVSGCGPCIGLGTGLLEKGEVGISSSNRNFKGRMGSREAECYLASPEVVVSSALHGHIAPSLEHQDTNTEPKGKCQITKTSPSTNETSNITAEPTSNSNSITGFKTKFCGIPICLPRNDISTDAVYSGKATYDDSITFEKQAALAFENYSPNVQTLWREMGKHKASNTASDRILIAGYNFGTGSSREQAVTSLVSAGVKCIIGGSFNSTYKRNAINNGLLYISCPELVNDVFGSLCKISNPGKVDDLTSDSLSEKVADNVFLVQNKVPTVVPGVSIEDNGNGVNANRIEVDVIKGYIAILDGKTNKVIKTYSVPSVGAAALDIITAGGLEKWVANQLPSKSTSV